MNIKKSILSTMLLSSAVLLSSCKKDGAGGDSPQHNKEQNPVNSSIGSHFSADSAESSRTTNNGFNKLPDGQTDNHNALTSHSSNTNHHLNTSNDSVLSNTSITPNLPAVPDNSTPTDSPNNSATADSQKPSDDPKVDSPSSTESSITSNEPTISDNQTTSDSPNATDKPSTVDTNNEQATAETTDKQEVAKEDRKEEVVEEPKVEHQEKPQTETEKQPPREEENPQTEENSQAEEDHQANELPKVEEQPEAEEKAEDEKESQSSETQTAPETQTNTEVQLPETEQAKSENSTQSQVEPTEQPSKENTTTEESTKQELSAEEPSKVEPPQEEFPQVEDQKQPINTEAETSVEDSKEKEKIEEEIKKDPEEGSAVNSSDNSNEISTNNEPTSSEPTNNEISSNNDQTNNITHNDNSSGENINQENNNLSAGNSDDNKNTDTENNVSGNNSVENNDVTLNLNNNSESTTPENNPSTQSNSSINPVDNQPWAKPEVEKLDKNNYQNTQQQSKFTNKIGIVDMDYNATEDLGGAFKFKDGRSRIHYNEGLYRQLKGHAKSHGTMVAGVIDLKNKNATIYAYSAENQGSGTMSATNQHYEEAYERGVRIFNNSYGNNPHKDSVRDRGWKNLANLYLYTKLAEMAERDSIFVWASGNEGKNKSTGRSEYATVEGHVPVVRDGARKGWIVVTSVDFRNSALKDYASKIGPDAKNWGIAAHGEWELFNGKAQTEGTSFATPVVTAAVANVWEKFDWMDHHLVTQTILSTANKLNSSDVTEEPNERVGWGVLNQDRALNGPARFDTKLLTDDNKNQVVARLDYKPHTDRTKYTWSNNIKGDAGFKKQGTGTLYFTGSNSYSGNTVIENGTLVIGNELKQSAVEIQSQGTLLTKNLVNAEKEVNIGKDINNSGSLEVYGKGLIIEGNYTTSNNARTVIDIDKSKLTVKGNVNLQNSRIVADVENINEVVSREPQTKTIIESPNAIKNYNGNYKISDRANPYIDLKEIKLNNENKEIIATYKRNDTEFVLKSANESSLKNVYTARSLDLILDSASDSGNTNGNLRSTALSFINAKPQAVASAVDSLSGEIYPAVHQVALNSIKTLNRQIAKQQFSNIQDIKPYHIYTQLATQSLKLYQDDNFGFADLKNSADSQLVGIDKQFNAFTFGMGLQRVHQKLSPLSSKDQQVGKVDLKQHSFALYGKYDWNKWYYLSQISFTDIKGKLDRTLLLPNGTQTIKADLKLQNYSFYNETGLNLQYEKLRFNPYVALHINRLKQDSINEKEDLALSIDKYHKTHYGYELGLRLNQSLSEELNINLDISYLYNKNSMDNIVSGKYIISNTETKLYGMRLPRYEFKTSLGMGYYLTENLNIYANIAYYRLWNNPMKSYYKEGNIGAKYNF
ncbi:S8 family serine peptidase [Glaesserella parasuis]|uniref:S8 family serine peptidase n=1 Tax=Glaesserella parasuis TaxID=738 RepID=UPI001365594C|nr:S8 family serine peptidase [Glaesserella parasuis]MDG6409048.1 autotransporter domain-containing protein [Glaesserella parasuis]MDO9779991.1 autotransporter domain-containing protein [Glaesserella parasuis]MDO9826087.1 autotransporter domain-containing protein [Glaesserella parasuis]MDO9854755.1 autotransporter domain-containing protein [Glaesserella parasuis]MDO9899297.1 autotransporter domain-containing protein [Glaesserella parasuis]